MRFIGEIAIAIFNQAKKKLEYIGTSSWKRERPTINEEEEALQKINVEY